MSTISDIYDGIKVVLDANLSSGTVYTDHPANPLEYPAIIAMPFQEYEVLPVGANSFRCVIPIEVRVLHTSQGEAMDTLFNYISPAGSNSLNAAIANDRTLNSSVDDAHIVPVGPMERDMENEGHANEWGYVSNLEVVVTVS